MVLGWGALAPAAVFVARYFKVLPWQDWPRELDNKTWWRFHWITQSAVLSLSVVGISLILLSPQNTGNAAMHRMFGFTVLLLGCCQVLSGLLRGTKGGPTAAGSDGSLRGDHYDMSLRRQLFETFHKIFGYLALINLAVAITSGLWEANALNWMWFLVFSWWAGLAMLAILLERRGWAIDTYRSIWGPDPTHPGNRVEISETLS